MTVKPSLSNREVSSKLIKETSHQMLSPTRVYSNCKTSASLGVVATLIEIPPRSGFSFQDSA